MDINGESFLVSSYSPQQKGSFMIESCKRQGYHHKSQLLNKTKDFTSPMSFIPLAPVHITPKEFENAALFLRMGLPSTLVCHENGAFRKRSSNQRNLKTSVLRFSAHRKHFENEAFRKRWGYENHVIFQSEFYSNTNPKWPVIVASSNSSGVVWTENIWCVFRVKPPFSNSSCVVWTRP